MNTADLRELADRADVVQGRAEARVEEVRARVGRARRRRQLGAVAATVVAVVLALTASSAVRSLSDDDVQPAKPAPLPTPTTTPGTPELVPGVRRLTWAEGRTIHWGDRTIDAGSKVWEVTPTDDGVVFMRDGAKPCFPHAAGCNELWFTDGSGISRIGTVDGSLVRGYALQTSASGSTVVWRESSNGDPALRAGSGRVGDTVVYDTRQRREVARMRSDHAPYATGWPGLEVQAVFDDAVYWTPDVQGAEWCAEYARYYGTCRRFRAVMRLDTATGVQSKVPWRVFTADRSHRPRMFVRPIRGEADTAGPVYDQVLTLVRDGNTWVADDGDGGAVVARTAGSGVPVRLRLPKAYTGVDVFFVVQWLDEDRVVVSPDSGDLLVCRLSTGRCRIGAEHTGLASFRSYG